MTHLLKVQQPLRYTDILTFALVFVFKESAMLFCVNRSAQTNSCNLCEGCSEV